MNGKKIYSATIVHVREALGFLQNSSVGSKKRLMCYQVGAKHRPYNDYLKVLLSLVSVNEIGKRLEMCARSFRGMANHVFKGQAR